MELSLSPELRKFVDAKVQSGAYQSPDEVIRNALARWKTEEEISPDELRRLVAEGQADADRGDLVDAETVFDEIRAKSARLRGK